MTVNYEIQSGFAEKQIEADVANYFGYMSPLFGRRLRLLDVNEQGTGADKRHFRNGVAYCAQVKELLKKLPDGMTFELSLEKEEN